MRRNTYRAITHLPPDVILSAAKDLQRWHTLDEADPSPRSG
ncbi:MAG TPA: hypothetical protein VFA41_21945 [Ktedonobacteraceae bacterium]|nr:hypothetical protein [Ktedonobacteraceae bacterium]